MPLSASRVRNRHSTLASKPMSVSSITSAYFQSIARTAIAAACRSVRSSANCDTVTSDNTPGDSPGAPRTPNASANGSSAKTSARRSRTRIARLPFGNAARATITVCAGTSGSPTGRIDTSYRLHSRTREEAASGTIIADPRPYPRSELRSRVACRGKALIVGDQKQLPPTSFILGMCKAGGVLAGCPDTGAHGFCPLDQEPSADIRLPSGSIKSPAAANGRCRQSTRPELWAPIRAAAVQGLRGRSRKRFSPVAALLRSVAWPV